MTKTWKNNSNDNDDVDNNNNEKFRELLYELQLFHAFQEVHASNEF